MPPERVEYEARRVSPYPIDEANDQPTHGRARESGWGILEWIIPKFLLRKEASPTIKSGQSLWTLKADTTDELPGAILFQTRGETQAYIRHEPTAYLFESRREEQIINGVAASSHSISTPDGRAHSRASLCLERQCSFNHRASFSLPLATPCCPAPCLGSSTSPTIPQRGNCPPGPSSPTQPAPMSPSFVHVHIRRPKADNGVAEMTTVTRSSGSFALAAYPMETGKGRELKVGDVHLHLYPADIGTGIQQLQVWTLTDEGWSPAGEGFQHPRADMHKYRLAFRWGYGKRVTGPVAKWILPNSDAKFRNGNDEWWAKGERQIDVWTP